MSLHHENYKKCQSKSDFGGGDGGAVVIAGGVAARGEPLCQSEVRVCSRPPLAGHGYCLQHVLEDKATQYKQCGYVSSRAERRCLTAVAPRSDKKDSYCNEHVQVLQAKKRGLKRPAPRESAATLLGDMLHSQHIRENSEMSAAQSSSTSTPLISPLSLKILDYPSDVDSSDVEKVEEAVVHQPHTQLDPLDPDLREYEDMFRNVEVLSGDEVIRLYKEKLVKLQSLYIEQFKILQYELQEERRNYLQQRQHELAHSGDVPMFGNTNHPEEWRRMMEVRHLLKYNRFCGVSKLLREKSRQKQASEGNPFSLGAGGGGGGDDTCKVVEQYGGERCNELVLPHTKYCLKHTIHDKKQVLWKVCTPGSCDKPLLPPLYLCHLHSPIHFQGPTTRPVKVEVKEETVD